MTLYVFWIVCLVIVVLAMGLCVAATWINVRSWRRVRNAARRQRLELHPRFRG